MSDTHGSTVPDKHGSSETVVGPHGSTSDHDDGHGHDDHAHGGEALGPIDWRMWGVGVVGVAAALLITAGFVVATGFVFGA